MIKLSNLKLNINFSQQDVKNKVCEALNIKQNNIKNIIYIKKSIDARKKPNIFYCLTVGVELSPNSLEEKINYPKMIIDNTGIEYKPLKTKQKTMVVGFGPSGMFVGLALAKMGLKPIIIEQGEQVEERIHSVQKFWNNGELNSFSNVQFGEGGAGTFSDGKLNTNLNNEYCKKVINELYLHGAPEQILYDSKPHIGSDKLTVVVKNIREHIKDLGGQVLFDTKLTEIKINENKVCGVVIKNVKNNNTEFVETDNLVLCLGHSARDSFKYIKQLGLKINPKPFAMGVRIEQKAENINQMQYGVNYDKNLPNADYKLVAHLPNGRSMFTFCMCPGGVVVASSSNQGEIVTNGMSYFARDNIYSNSALLVNITPQDYKSDDVLAGIYFQEKYEKLAYDLGGGNFSAPVESVGSFLYNKQNSGECSYSPKYKFSKLKNCLPDFVYESLKLGIKEFNKKYKYFAQDDDILVGVETRSSSPITILRDENYESNISGIYPCGEGAGYAGGIISSAQDGIKVAEAIYNKLKTK